MQFGYFLRCSQRQILSPQRETGIQALSRRQGQNRLRPPHMAPRAALMLLLLSTIDARLTATFMRQCSGGGLKGKRSVETMSLEEGKCAHIPGRVRDLWAALDTTIPDNLHIGCREYSNCGAIILGVRAESNATSVVPTSTSLSVRARSPCVYTIMPPAQSLKKMRARASAAPPSKLKKITATSAGP